MPFINVCYLIALAWTSSIMLDRSGESGHLCLILILDEKHSAVGFSYMDYIILR